MNKIVLLGRITKDIPEIKEKGETSYTSFTIAVNEGTGDDAKATFFDLFVLNKQAEFIKKYGKVGARVLIEGKMNLNWYEAEGGNRLGASVLVNQLTLIDWPEKEDVKDEKKSKSSTKKNEGLPF